MKWRAFCILLVGSLILLLGAGVVSASQRVFPDVQVGNWAEKDIAEMKAKGNIAGYSDGYFHPNEKLSREQTVAMLLRVAGLKGSKPQYTLEEHAKSEGVSWQKNVSPWAKEALAVAWENGIIPEAALVDFRPQSPVKRYEIAEFAVQAMGLTEAAKAKTGSGLTFSDSADIPAASKGYVEVAVEKKIFTGNPDNTFRPKQELTRLQVAAILERIDELQENAYSNFVTGEVVSSPDLSATMAIKDASGKEKVFTLSSKAFIYDGRNAVIEQLPFAAVMPGATVELVTGSDGLVIYAELLDEASAGFVSQEPGDSVSPEPADSGDGEKVLDYLTGKITDIYPNTDTLVIKTSDNKVIVVAVASDTAIVKFGKKIDFNDLEEGNEIVTTGVLDGSVIEASGIMLISAVN